MDDLIRRAKFLGSLTPRERQVFSLACAGKLNSEIAHELGITVRTVGFHKVHVYEKFGIDELQDTPRRLELHRFCMVLEAVGFEGPPPEPVPEVDDETAELPSVPTRAWAAVVNDDRELAQRRQADESARRKPALYEPAQPPLVVQEVPTPPVIPPPDRSRLVLIGALGVIGVLLVALIAVLLRGPSQQTVIREVAANVATSTDVGRAAPTPTPTRTPQVLTSPTFATNLQDIKCYEAPDATTAVLATLPAGTVQTFDRVFLDRNSMQWYRESEKQCWVLNSPANEQFFSTRDQAVSAAGKFLPAGTVLYQADWTNGLQGWTAAPGWKTVDGQLLSDGSNGDANQWLLAPFRPGDVANYAVEVELEGVRWLGTNVCLLCDYDGSYGIAVRVINDNGYGAGRHYSGSAPGDLRFEMWRRTGHDWNSLNSRKNDLSAGRHMHRLEVRANQIRYLVDGVVVAEATDNSYLAGGQVGLWSNKAAVTVYGFKIIKL